ncbi:cytochrome o ubiquinol oxidase subunit III [Candidatus Saccharibacteria bacterium]|nr:MAG: cytochrome o ubiquinol oxidase subunit III [Candidatus Saccharibacteria bacterium]
MSKGSLPSQLPAADSKGLFGFWVYLMTDCILFASLFATFIVLRGNTAGGVGGSDIFELPFVLAETLILLASSLASGLALLAAHRRSRHGVFLWFGITGMLGLLFVSMEVYEFSKLVSDGHSWTNSAFLSSYFGLVGTHGLHISVGLIWLAAILLHLKQRTFNPRLLQRLTMFTMFWHFLDIVWIGIFTIVYLVGVI